MENQSFRQSADTVKQFAEQAYKAQMATLKSTAEIQQLYLKAIESQTKANYDFATGALGAEQVTDLNALWPNAMGFLRSSVEAAYTTDQQIWEIVQKTTKELGELAEASAQTAGDATRDTMSASQKRVRAAT